MLEHLKKSVITIHRLDINPIFLLFIALNICLTALITVDTQNNPSPLAISVSTIPD
jgi:hypothetical protein